MKERNRNVIYRAAAGGFALQLPMMRVTMNDEIRAMSVNHFGQSR